MESTWKNKFLSNLTNSHYSNDEYKQFKPFLNILFDGLENYLTSLHTSDDEVDRRMYEGYEAVLSEWLGYIGRINSRKDNHFGYPMNLSKRSFIVDFFRLMESLDVNQNNFGNILDVSGFETVGDSDDTRTSRINYALDTKSTEWDIVRLLAENLGLPPQPRLVEILQNPKNYKDGYWGYVTSGGSESNLWGINQGFTEYPDGVLYFCEAAHYSMGKSAKNRSCQVIQQKSADDEAIDVAELIAAIKTNWYSLRRPAIMVLTYGTTKFGSCDDVAAIKKHLVELGIPHYIHIDAALFGGIPNNQTNAPQVGNIDEWGYNSIAVSMHKYIGYPIAKGVLISTKRPQGRFVDYVGQEDNTVLGSRDAHGFSLRQQVMEVLQHSDPQEYITNVKTFAEMLSLAGTDFRQWIDGDKKGNIFVLKVDKSVQDYHDICKRWQLSEFTGKDDIPRIHVIIFHSHSQKNLQMLANDLAKIALR